MVVFTCQGCNASLKKKQAPEHVKFCRKSTVLTCVDCLKDFDQTSCQKHMCTVTENQRYGGQNYVAKPSAIKQALWVESALAAASSPSVSNHVKTLIEMLAENPALPRIKKKFINLVMNNNQLRDHKKYAEQAFDLILAEMEKREGTDGTNNADNSNGTGKRKTISETQEDPDAISNSNVDDKKKGKKKKKKRDSSDNASSEIQETQEEDETTNKPIGKKSKRKTISETQPDVEPEEKVPCEQPVDVVNTSVEEKKMKKKKKSVSYEDDKLSSEPVSDDTENVIPDTAPENGENVDDKQDLTKLSKKERKKLLKQKKFAAELESIENYQRDEANLDESVDDKKKKKKKNKENIANGHENGGKDCKLNGEGASEKQQGEVCEDEAEEQVEEKPKNFKWEIVIREALKSASDHEMSLKRLSKKVCGEYVLVHGMKDSYEDILLRFNKKVVKTPGVRVFKDKAMLCHS